MIKKEHLELKGEEKGPGGGCHEQRQPGFLSLGDSPLRLFFAAHPWLSWAARPDGRLPGELIQVGKISPLGLQT